MKKSFKILLSALTIGVFIFIAAASGKDKTNNSETDLNSETEQNTEMAEKPEINIGSTYTFDTYHKIKFKTENRYLISQPYGCVGEGNWSLDGDKVILEQNDSDCESTRKIKGVFSIDEIVN